jgi:hypothetical protein
MRTFIKTAAVAAALGFWAVGASAVDIAFGTTTTRTIAIQVEDSPCNNAPFPVTTAFPNNRVAEAGCNVYAGDVGAVFFNFDNDYKGTLSKLGGATDWNVTIPATEWGQVLQNTLGASGAALTAVTKGATLDFDTATGTVVPAGAACAGIGGAGACYYDATGVFGPLSFTLKGFPRASDKAWFGQADNPLVPGVTDPGIPLELSCTASADLAGCVPGPFLSAICPTPGFAAFGPPIPGVAAPCAPASAPILRTQPLLTGSLLTALAASRLVITGGPGPVGLDAIDPAFAPLDWRMQEDTSALALGTTTTRTVAILTEDTDCTNVPVPSTTPYPNNMPAAAGCNTYANTPGSQFAERDDDYYGTLTKLGGATDWNLATSVAVWTAVLQSTLGAQGAAVTGVAKPMTLDFDTASTAVTPAGAACAGIGGAGACYYDATGVFGPLSFTLKGFPRAADKAWYGQADNPLVPGFTDPGLPLQLSCSAGADLLGCIAGPFLSAVCPTPGFAAFGPDMLGNTLCTALDTPYDCCTGAGSGTCTAVFGPGNPCDPALVPITLAQPGFAGTALTALVASRLVITGGPGPVGLDAIDPAFAPLDLGLAEVEGTVAADFDADAVPSPSDNCDLVANVAQTDTGGLGAGSMPDGIGDACQCGDINNSGVVDSTDFVLLNRSSLGLSPYFSLPGMPGYAKCDVNASAPACSSTDGVVINRAVLNLAPGIGQYCTAADGSPL